MNRHAAMQDHRMPGMAVSEARPSPYTSPLQVSPPST